jgi:hypothetical protein
MLTFQECERLMKTARGGRRKLANATYLHKVDKGYAVRLHCTDVVVIHPDGTYTLDTGGYNTVTTKDRLNRYSPVQVWQKDFEWFWRSYGDLGGALPFQNGLRVDANGKQLGGYEFLPETWDDTVAVA